MMMHKEWLMNLNKLNFNLLLALDVLLAERHVTRAANKLNITQSAMSNNLKQLRELFNDPLLVRTKNAMVLTVKAQGLVNPLREIMTNAKRLVFTHAKFDPKTDESEFSIGLSDYAGSIILSDLLADISKKSPNMKINIRPMTSIQDLHDFEQGFLHLAIGFFVNPPPNLKRQHLYTDEFLCVMSKKHALAKKELTLERFLSCRQMTLTLRDNYGGSNVEDHLIKHGISYNPIVRIPYSMVALQVVSQTDFVLVTSKCMLKQVTDFPLALKNVPFDKASRSVSQYWHSQYHNDPAHQWLRQRIKILTEKL